MCQASGLWYQAGFSGRGKLRLLLTNWNTQTVSMPSERAFRIYSSLEVVGETLACYTNVLMLIGTVDTKDSRRNILLVTSPLFLLDLREAAM